MGCMESKSVPQGTIIVDSVIITNSKARITGDLVQIPIKSLSTGESSVITIDRRGGVVRVSRGMIHGRLSHDELIDSPSGQKKEIHHESFSF